MESNYTNNISLPLITENTTGVTAREKNVSYQVLQTLSYSILIILSLIGNSLVIATVIRNTNKRMRSVSNILIVNLSIADLLITLVNMPSKIAQIFIGYEWLVDGTFGLVLCKFMNLVPFLAVCVSTQSFSVLALDRFVAVYLPVKRPITTKVAYVLIALVWISSVGFYYVYCHSARILYYANHTYCHIDAKVVFGSSRNFKVFVWVEFIVVILIPLIVAFVFYAATMARLWKRRIPGVSTQTNVSYTERVNRKVLKMLVTVYLVFLFCWLPSWIWIITCVRLKPTLGQPSFCSSSDFRIFRFIVAYSNSAITPFVYLMFSENYREGFREIIAKIVCCPSVRAMMLRNNRIRPSFSITYNLQDKTGVSITGKRVERLEISTVI